MWINLTDEEIEAIKEVHEEAEYDVPNLVELIERIEAKKLIWIRNLGKGPAAGTLVDVEFRHGGIATNRPAKDWDWSLDGGDSDIVAYRLVEDFTA
jgi:hypothetical protein